MEQLIEEVYEIIKDYRADEEKSEVKITKNRIKTWINQFAESDQEVILTELVEIFKKRYCSKLEARTFLKEVIEGISKNYKYSTVKDFLRETTFLDLQPNGKSQKVLLDLVNELLLDDYQISLAECGLIKKNFIYLDDILCTGNTLFQDIKEWSGQKYTSGITYQQAVENGSIHLWFVFIVSHEKNIHKKFSQMSYKISESFASKLIAYPGIQVQNSGKSISSTLDFCWPMEDTQPEIVKKYKDKILKDVNDYLNEKNYGDTPEEFYRNKDFPQTEKLFTSPENRMKFENAILRKGIEILANASTNIRNMRALGYSLPSQKDFGFGTLSFTWRNIPNNAPLVFWYSGGNWLPLFNVKRDGSIISDLKIKLAI